MMNKKKRQGFTLIELMIAMAVIGILAVVALPSYTQYIVRANRSAAQSAMLAMSNKQEQYMLDTRAYASGSTASTLWIVNLPAEVTNNYAITVTAMVSTAVIVAPPNYLITAMPLGSQLTRDTKCGTVTLNHLGVKTEGGTASSYSECW